MKQITPAALDRARDYLYRHARPLERARFAYSFENAPADSVLHELARFQHDDGGFGRKLEPDMWAPTSSVLATTTAFQLLRELRVDESHPMARAAMEYLLAVYDPEAQVWPLVPSSVAEAPHAPWWEYDAELPARFDFYRANPRAEIVGYLYDYAGLAPAALRAELTDAVVEHLDSLPQQISLNDFLCLQRLAETDSLLEPVRRHVEQRLLAAAPHSVATDPAQWRGYSLQPVQVAKSPLSPFASRLAAAIEANLDFLVETQGEDGTWRPTWDWGGRYAEQWPEAERAWRGALTVDTLCTLRQWGRLDGGG